VDAWSMGHAIAEVARVGCRIERVAPVGRVLVLADPRGKRWFLALGGDGCSLAREGDGRPVRHETVADAVGALARATA
jgi:hypothetical protein